MSINSTMPEALTTGKVWELLSADYVLKTINTGTGGDPSDASTTGPSNGNTGSCTLTVDQIPSHTHTQKSCTNPGDHTHSYSTVSIYGPSSPASSTTKATTSTGTTGGGGKHTHTITLNNTGGGKGHTHSLNNHTHLTGMPANIGVYVWKRTA